MSVKLNQQIFLEDLKRGERSAVLKVYETIFPACSKYINNNNGTTDDARDVFQEALIILFRKIRIESFELTSTIKTFLYSIVRHLWLKQLDKKKRGGLSLVIDDEGDQEFIIIQEDELEEKVKEESLHQQIKIVLQTFKADCKKLLLAYYFKKTPLKDIGDEMGYSNKFVRVKKNRCMNALKKEISQRFPEEE